MALVQYTDTNGKLLTIQTDEIVAYYPSSATTTRVIVQNVSYNLAVAVALFETGLELISPFVFEPINNTAGVSVRIRLDSLTSFKAGSATTTIVVIREISFTLAITYANFQTLAQAAPELTLLAASFAATLEPYINNATPQTQTIYLQLDRKSELVGEIEFTPDPDTIPTNFTITPNPGTVTSDEQAVAIEVSYTGAGADETPFNIEFSLTANGVQVGQVVLPLEVEAEPALPSGLLAASFAPALENFINNDTPQTQSVFLQLDRKSELVGEVTATPVPGTIPTNFTFTPNPVIIGSNVQAFDVAVEYTGTGAAATAFQVEFTLSADGIEDETVVLGIVVEAA